MNKIIRRTTIFLLSISIIATSSLIFAQAPPPATDGTRAMAAMTNDDVIKMAKMGFGSEVIEAKIQQAGAVDFKLEVDDLSRLKAAGVPQGAISAMLRRSGGKADAQTEAQAPSMNAPPPMSGVAGVPTFSDVGAVKLITKDNAVELRSSAGTMSTTYAYVTVLVHCNYPGLKADVRIHDPRPTLLVRSEKSPKGRLYLVSADVDKRNGVRSVKMGNSRLFGAKNIGAPDSDNQIEYEVTSAAADIWRLTPTKDLGPGEYGLWNQMRELYDFGVDP